MKKKYVAEIIFPEGNNEFWEDVKDNGHKVLEDEIILVLEDCGFFGAEVKVVEIKE